MALSALIGSLKYYFDLAFQLGRNTSAQVWVMGAAAAVNILLNLLWIPAYGTLGAAYSSLAAYLLALLMSFWLGSKSFPLPLFNKGTLKILAAATIMGLALWPTRSLVGPTALVIQILAGALVYGLALVMFDVGHSRRRVAKLLA
jgi:O-antigen/teichoic acid export membrane protein